jgi:hypothetical protein
MYVRLINPLSERLRNRKHKATYVLMYENKYFSSYYTYVMSRYGQMGIPSILKIRRIAEYKCT